MDPDHPLAALVLKARQERNGTATVATKAEDVADPVVSGTPAQFNAEREYGPEMHCSPTALVDVNFLAADVIHILCSKDYNKMITSF